MAEIDARALGSGNVPKLTLGSGNVPKNAWAQLVCILCLSFCVSVRLYPINVKTAEPIEPTFCVDLTRP